MTHLFRYLLLIYVIGSGLLLGMFLGWQQHVTEQRQHWYLQQYAELLKVSLRPYLRQVSAEQLSSHLTELQYSAFLPVAALGIYLPNGELLASAGSVTDLPTIFSPNNSVQYQLQAHDNIMLAIQPLYQEPTPADHFGAYQLPDAYLAIAPEPSDKIPALLWPLLVSWLIYTLSFLAMLVLLLIRRRQRLAFVDRVQQAEDAEVAELTRLPADLYLLQQLIQLKTDTQHSQAEQITELQQQLVLLQQLNQQQTLTISQEQEQAATQLLHISHWLHQYQLLYSRQAQLSAPVFQALVHLHVLYGVFRFSKSVVDTTALPLMTWLAPNLTFLNNLLKSGVDIEWLEGAENRASLVLVNEKLLLAVLQAMLLLVQRSDNASHIYARLTLVREPVARLQLHLNIDGNGLPAYINQQLGAGDSQKWQWRDADIALLQTLSQVLDADLNVQSLAGFGCSVRFSFPVNTDRVMSTAMLGHVIVFDEDAERLSERLPALAASSAQVTTVTSLAELQHKLTELKPELVLLMLPAIEPTHAWSMLLSAANEQFTLQAYASAPVLPHWQALLPCVNANEFCLQRLLNIETKRPHPTAMKKLLVVDDNETNQAFVSVLLKDKPINTYSALTGQEALKLCQQQQFDMILLDIRLPDMAGTDVANLLRQMTAYRFVPILAFTAHALPHEITEFKQAGMDDILLKPLDPFKFEALLCRYKLLADK